MYSSNSTDEGWQTVPQPPISYDNTSQWVSQEVEIWLYHNEIIKDLCCSTILIYAHEHYDHPVIDAVAFYWPSKVAKFEILKNATNFHTMELERTSKMNTNLNPCSSDPEYSVSKEGTDVLDVNME